MNKSAPPLVSVILSVYNGEKFLKAAIQSILKQTYPHFEILIINDGSTDTTLSIIQSFLDDRIQLVDNEENKGISHRRNKGLALAKGKYIAVMDADDISLPNRLERQVAFLEAHPEIALLGTQVQLLIESQQQLFTPKKMPLQHSDILAYMLFYCPFIHSSVMFRAAIAKTHQYDTDFPVCVDYALWTQLLQKYKAANLNEVLVHYRIHKSNITLIRQQAVLARVRQIAIGQLEGWKIPYTQEELDTHLLLSDSNSAMLSREQLTRIVDWLEKLKQHNEKHQLFEAHYFECLVNIVMVESWKWKVEKPSNYFTMTASPLYKNSISWRDKWQVLRSFFHRLRQA